MGSLKIIPQWERWVRYCTPGRWIWTFRVKIVSTPGYACTPYRRDLLLSKGIMKFYILEVGINRKPFRSICFFLTGKVYEEDYY